ncbi:hypothetical protein THAOC_33453 [Thalassiosira oceanica]|uniref:SCP domain-containing protein n=1 Tax=Thalassiosira oceanica TaxID=159749 RepID=K0R554_THAOC|nr:hypothetical protein THAOC_33453 [Thalassiosira oceanica]|eukprot:EJK47810.1 hypothetical protein THAOC_33453 [Thalassiosira oceanica]
MTSSLIFCLWFAVALSSSSTMALGEKRIDRRGSSSRTGNGTRGGRRDINNDDLNGRVRSGDWSRAHKKARDKYHNEKGYSTPRMMWNRDLQNFANEYAAQLAQVCEDGPPSNPEADKFAYVVASKQDSRSPDTPEEILSQWEEKFLSATWPDNEDFSQVLWRQTEYLGCSDAVTPNASDLDKPCAYRGNCNLEEGMSKDEQMEQILNGFTCGECPPNKNNCMDTNNELLPKNPPGGLTKVA